MKSNTLVAHFFVSLSGSGALAGAPLHAIQAEDHRLGLGGAAATGHGVHSAALHRA